MADMAHHVQHVAEQTMPEPLSPANVEKMTAAVKGLARPGHPVRSLLRRRAFDELRRHFDAAAPPDVSCKSNTGLNVIDDALHVVCVRAAQLAHHNKAVCCNLYDQLLRDMELGAA